MRVFDIYTYNIASKVKFKDTPKYIDAMLKELGCGYKNVAFTYNNYITKVEQVLEKYPELSKYCFEYEPYGEKILTSLTPDWTKGDIYAKKEDYASLFEIISKCPRGGMNITGKLVFDQIDWYGEGVKEAALSCDRDDVGKAAYFITGEVVNSQIILQREYDELVGKNNRVDVVVEATALGNAIAAGKTAYTGEVADAAEAVAAGEPRDTTDIIKKLAPYLGTPESNYRICRNPLHEEWELLEKAEKCAKLLCRRIDDFCPRRWRESTAAFIPRLADKKKIMAAFSGTSFKMSEERVGLPGMNMMCCTDAKNRKYSVLFDRTQSSPDYFYWYIYINGYNFSLASWQNIVYASSGYEAEAALRQIAAFCEKLIDEFDSVLTENFGATPEWYVY